ncbi:jerky protein homolog-like [Phlebotomus papatasi]|uniref:jerky protein homolog-like n=1 Tax=Phlebotomus papatasi TaxID=29031 RepID=UPI002483DDFA|nr:jerky protein homolog-like [Phlebotomus papatasi]
MKRKYTTTKIQVKLKAIELVKNGESVKDVAASYGVGKQTVLDWVQQEERLKNYVNSNARNNNSMTMRPGLTPQTSEALFIWFEHMRERGVPVSGSLLQAKALQFHEVFEDGPANFSASSGWLTRWKKEHEVRQLTVCGEALSSREEMLPTFYKHLQEVIESENLGYHQIYNADETGLNFRKLPNKTLAARTQRSASGFKQSKERITILACANASGTHKIPLFVIGKSNVLNAIKAIDILKTIAWISQAWTQVDSNTIARSWKRVFEITFSSDVSGDEQLLNYEDNTDEGDVEHLIQLANALPHNDSITEDDIAIWLQSDNSLDMSDSTIVDMVRNKNDISEQEVHDEQEELLDQNLVRNQISPEEALRALDVVLSYVRQRKESLPTIMTIHRLREDAAHSRGIILN